MALNLKNERVERLIEEIVAITGETKTGAVLVALEERRARLGPRPSVDRASRLRRFLETEAWPCVPSEARQPLTRDEEDEILGYGPEGM